MSDFKIFTNSMGSIIAGSVDSFKTVRIGDEIPLGVSQSGDLFYKKQEPNSGLYVFEDGVWEYATSISTPEYPQLKTGSEITFDKDAIWNTSEMPTGLNLTQNLSPTPSPGTTQIVYHSSLTVPEFPDNWTLSAKSQPYSTSSVNIITIEYTDNNNINYYITPILEPFTVEIEVSSAPLGITVPVIISSGNYTIDWGDNSPIVPNVSTHTYNDNGTYKIKIRGIVNNLNFSNDFNPDLAQSVKKVYGSEPLYNIELISFKGCSSMTSFDTTSLKYLTNCSDAWQNCMGLTSFDTSSLTSVTNCSRAWQGCVGLTTFNASGLTSVIDCSYAWLYCVQLTSFDTTPLKSVKYCQYAWGGCTQLTEFNTNGLTSVLNCSFSWDECTNLTQFNADGLISAKYCYRAWRKCGSLLTTGTLSFTNNTGLKSAIDCENAWEECKLSTFSTANLTSVVNCKNAWKNCTLSSFFTSGLISVKDCSNAWEGCSSLSVFNANGLRSVTDCSNAWKDCTVLASFNNATALTSVTTCASAWENCEALSSFDASGLTSVTTCTSAWKDCDVLETFDASGLISVTNCDNAWNGCVALATFINNSYPQALNSSTVTSSTTAFAGAGSGAPSAFPYQIYKTVAEDANSFNITLNTDAVWFSYDSPLSADFSLGNKTISLKMDPNDLAVDNTQQIIYFSTTNQNTTFTISKLSGTGTVYMVNSPVTINNNNEVYIAKIRYSNLDAFCEVIEVVKL